MSDLLTFVTAGLHRTLLPMWVAVVLLWLLERFVVRLTPRHRCWLWRLLFLKCIVVFFVPLGLPMPPLPMTALSLGSAAAAVGPTAASAGSVGSAERAAVFAPPAVANANAATATTAGDLAAAVPTTGGTLDVASGLLLLWSLGVCVHVALLAHHHGVLSARLRRGNVASLPAPLRTLYADVARQMRVHRPPRLCLNDRFTSPALVCHGRVQIVLPANFFEQHGADACRVALAHELAHYRRHDLFWNTLVAVVSIGLFFFPPLWLARRRYRLAMESACDWDAIRYGRVGLALYARLLVALVDTGSRRSPALGIVPMSGSETFRSLSERLAAMKRFQLLSRGAWAPRTITPRALVSLAMLCVLVPWSRADDRYRRTESQRSPGSQTPQGLPGSQSSTASVSSSSSSFSGPGGRVFSNAQVSANATGNASGSGLASSGATTQALGDRKQTFSSAAGTAEGKPDRSNSSEREANSNRRLQNLSSSSSSAVIVNGIRLTRITEAGGQGTRTQLKVLDKEKEYFIVQSKNRNREWIEVRVRDSGKALGEDTNEKVYTANSRDQLKRREPDLVRAIERYEKLAGNAEASVDMERGRANSRAWRDNLDPPQENLGGNAQQMMLDQLRQMQQQHADNAQMQGMLRQMLEDVEKSSP
ncbi:M56 family metallopeptidase [Roseimaritima ulvae]|uniref:Regulatory protein BlaR1 n=1 Tax=Roseimaritima ulvae TaxID=980254 RepID=A0A5B9QLY2_9BACT|nr:M56 family metallopeptidase [Roseimaritima ulvae]QEG39954.1 Regulatory protein BlaR1 [Roseimaritima ulvae]